MSKKHITDFQTDAGVSVKERIEKGKTRSFKNLIEAIEFARSTGSYVYDLMARYQQGSTITVEFYGFAVPK